MMSEAGYALLSKAAWMEDVDVGKLFVINVAAINETKQNTQ